ncbi:MAG: dTDP-4-dehydrorhamnose reductase [Chitinispirillia bacterium]|nr:dTDP-4-dehydrorhamnose reductase [Chitinispirillia bacterium]MCL2184121.1 dTDP-4-dehydrorhamnose reductase [Chitinispirillia bacterium]MCL2269649.1 dTDP-4-dehydrorhamnose reductase [Chitinispirillia bacterium]
MRLLIIGSGGQLGRDFTEQAAMAGHGITAVDYPQIDIRDKSSVNTFIDDTKPEAIINCAAFTAVDDCESQRDKAFALNADACGILAEAAKRVSAVMAHFSTDYVFDGTGSAPYTEDSPTGPQSIYGKSKLAGEEAIVNTYDDIMIFRIAWLYGAHGNNFVKTIRKTASANAREGKPLKVVNDQFGTPTWTVSVCRQVLAMLDRSERGVFHSTSEGSCSWFDFAMEIVASAGINVDIRPCTTEEFPRPAPRPCYSVLENARLKAAGANIMPEWKDGFREFLSTADPLTFNNENPLIK